MKQIILDNIRFDRKLLLNLTKMFYNEVGTCLLYSGGSFETAQSSFLCLFPYDEICIERHRQWRTGVEGSQRIECHETNPWEALKFLLPPLNGDHSFPEWVGYISYEMGAFSDQEQQQERPPSHIPFAYMQRSGVIIAVDHIKERGTVIIADPARYFLNEEQIKWIHRFKCKEHWEELAQNLSSLEDFTVQAALSAKIVPAESPEMFKDKVRKALELIHAGEI